MINKSKHINRDARKNATFTDFSFDRQFSPKITEHGTHTKTPYMSNAENLQVPVLSDGAIQTEPEPTESKYTRISIPDGDMNGLQSVLERGFDLTKGTRANYSHIKGVMPKGTKLILRVLKRDGNGWHKVGDSIHQTLTEDRTVEVIARLAPYKGHWPFECDRHNWTACLMYQDERDMQVHRQIVYRLPSTD